MDEADATQRRARKDARRNLERVLQAAHELFAERGADVTMEEVARRAGVGVGTVYRRFPSKEHLFAAVSHAACADMQQCAHQAIEVERDPLGKLRALVVMHYRRSAHQVALLELRPAPSASVQACLTPDASPQLYAALHHILHHLIVEGQGQGMIRQGDANVLAALCLELLHPHAVQNLLRVIGGGPDAAAEYVVRFLLSGLRPSP